MNEVYNRFAIEVERSQRERLLREALASRMAGCSLRRELGISKRLLLTVGRQLIRMGQKLQAAAQFEPTEAYVPALYAD